MIWFRKSRDYRSSKKVQDWHPKLSLEFSKDFMRTTVNSPTLSTLYRRTVDGSNINSLQDLFKQLKILLSHLENEPHTPTHSNWDEQYVVQLIEIARELANINNTSQKSFKGLFEIRLKLRKLASSFEGSKQISKLKFLLKVYRCIFE